MTHNPQHDSAADLTSGRNTNDSADSDTAKTRIGPETNLDPVDTDAPGTQKPLDTAIPKPPGVDAAAHERQAAGIRSRARHNAVRTEPRTQSDDGSGGE